MANPIQYAGPNRAPFWPIRQELKGVIILPIPPAGFEVQAVVRRNVRGIGWVDGQALAPIKKGWVDNYELVLNTNRQSGGVNGDALPSVSKGWVDNYELVLNTNRQRGGVDGEGFSVISSRGWIENYELVLNTNRQRGGVNGEALTPIIVPPVPPFDNYYGYGRRGGKDISFLIAQELDIDDKDDRFEIRRDEEVPYPSVIGEEKTVETPVIEPKKINRTNKRTVRNILTTIEYCVTILSSGTMVVGLVGKAVKKRKRNKRR